jgi:hypothetical protein
MQDIRRVLPLGLVAALAIGACDSGATNPTDLDASAGSTVCGTHAKPGILKLTGRSPAIGATVVNQGIVHGFVVENAPAVFTNFTLEYGATHTAGPSTPSDPTFQATPSGNNLIYQLTVDAWSHAPGHVELEVGTSYDTSKGCTWAFPSPLFSYDITQVLDGGTTEGGAVDGRVGSVDSPYDIPGALDVAAALDAPAAVDAPVAIDGPAVADGPAEPDVPVVVDAAVDGAPSVDAGMD